LITEDNFPASRRSEFPAKSLVCPFIFRGYWRIFPATWQKFPANPGLSGNF
jgi:hypothetical protein